MTFAQAGAIIASLAISVHQTTPPPDVLLLRDHMDGSLRLNGGMLPKHFAAGILTWIDRLSPADGLCHGDLNPGNVIMTAESPQTHRLDRCGRAPAAFDLAFCHVGLAEIAPEIVDNPERPRALNAAVESEYARLAGIAPAALRAEIERYLPIAYVYYILGDPHPAWRARLIQRVEAALRPQH